MIASVRMREGGVRYWEAVRIKADGNCVNTFTLTLVYLRTNEKELRKCTLQ